MRVFSATHCKGTLADNANLMRRGINHSHSVVWIYLFLTHFKLFLKLLSFDNFVILVPISLPLKWYVILQGSYNFRFGLFRHRMTYWWIWFFVHSGLDTTTGHSIYLVYEKKEQSFLITGLVSTYISHMITNGVASYRHCRWQPTPFPGKSTKYKCENCNTNTRIRCGLKR